MYGDSFVDNVLSKYIKSLDDVNIFVKNNFHIKSQVKNLKLWAFTISCGYFKSFEEIINHESFNDNEKSFVLLTPYFDYRDTYEYLNPTDALILFFRRRYQYYNKYFEINGFSEDDFSKWITILAIKNNNSEEIIKYIAEETCFKTLDQANTFLIPLYKISSKKDEILIIKVQTENKSILFSDLLKKYD